MPNTREKPSELIRSGRRKAEDICNRNDDCERCTIADPDGNCKALYIADHPIVNGVTIPEWISVEDRLPKNGGVVLVHGTRGGIYTAEFRLYSDFGGEYPHWHKRNSKSHYCKATHWMPLPQPPKGE